MRKISTLLMLFCTFVGAAWAQALVETSTEANPKYYTMASFSRGGILTYESVGGAMKHNNTVGGNGSWYFVAAPGDANNGVYIVNKNKDGENKIYLDSDRNASKTPAVWYILPNGVNSKGFSISKTNPISTSSCLDAGNNSSIGTWDPRSNDWEGTTWVFVGDIENPKYNPNNLVQIQGTGGRYISSITINGTTHSAEARAIAYADFTSSVTFTVPAGREVPISIARGGNWMHAYAYVDVAGDGFTEEDAVSYSYLAGKNSLGEELSGSNTIAMPDFVTPTTPGVYRMRVKYDWDDLNPNGTDGKITSAGGQFVDVTLVVEDPLKVLRNSLSELIAETKAGLGKVALQTTDASAAFHLTAVQDADGNTLSKAIDGDPATFFGTTWGASLGYLHYWQVDLVDASNLPEFTFSYTTRSNGNDCPATINVKGSNDGVTFTDIVVLNELPAAASATYTSNVIENAGYRYIRFEVPATNNNFHPADAEEVTFAIAEFSIVCTDANAYSAKDKDILAMANAAQLLVDDLSATEEQLNVAYRNLKVAALPRPAYPFVMTSNDASPELYALKSGRGDAYWYTYDATDGKIALSAYTGAQTQLWYFKEFVSDDYQIYVQIYPFLGSGKAMSYENTNDDPAKIVAKELNTSGWTNTWKVVATNGTAPYGFQTSNGANYLSNNGGVGNKMGMWNAAPQNDEGTAVYFMTPETVVEELIEKAESFYAYEGVVGGVTSETVVALKAAVNTAKGNIVNKDYSVDGLNSAISSIEIVLPETGKFYVLKNNYTNKYLGVADGAGLIALDAATMGQVFTFTDAGEGAFYLKSVERASYLSTAPGHGGGQASAAAFVESGAKAVTISSLGKANQVSLTPNGGATLHHDTNYGTIVGWNSGVDSKSAWIISEVNIEDYAHTVEVGEAGWATLVLGYNATIPAGVTAYAVTDAEGSATLAPVTGAIPANEAVLLQAEAGNYDFELADTAEPVATNLLKGTVFDTNIAEAAYVLGYVGEEGNKEVGFYTATLNQAEGTAFKNNAFKAYLPKTGVSSTLRFNFGGTTAIESVLNNGIDANAAIYDLSGRRVEKAVKGIYIQNGKKIIVK